MKDFLDCVRTRREPSCSIENGYQSTTTVKLAMIAYETSSVVQWDPVQEQIIGNPQAAALLKRNYRKPWIHPYTDN
ncbi:MAG: hypothetical protein R6V06_02885 [Kiritimatiellia bacterium]